MTMEEYMKLSMSVNESSVLVDLKKKDDYCKKTVLKDYMSKHNIDKNKMPHKHFLEQEFGHCDAVQELLKK